MTWILYIVTGLSVPSLQQIAVYTDEQICIKTAKELATKNIRSVCIPKEKSA